MQVRSGAKRLTVRGKQANTQFSDGLGDVVEETTRLWRKNHLGYDQTKYVVEQARRPAETATAGLAPAHNQPAGQSGSGATDPESISV